MNDPVLSREDDVQIAIIDFRSFAPAAQNLLPGNVRPSDSIAHGQGVMGWHALTKSERSSLDDYMEASLEDRRRAMSGLMTSRKLRERVTLIKDVKLMNRILGATRTGPFAVISLQPVVDERPAELQA